MTPGLAPQAPVRLVCISDTHDRHAALPHPLPAGDVLIHCGDATQLGLEEDLRRFAAWFAAQPHRHKLFVPGAHDTWCGELPARAAELVADCEVLLDREVTIAGLARARRV
jgi:3',5'-cyclic AMP phosphodiesterase CpdA